jgi:cobyrinic acid a,c-diamide synthase
LAKGLVIAAPASGSGKTILTLGLLRALKNHGLKVASAKVGPDYIDPRFHEAATGRHCFNLDPWAMSEQQIGGYLATLAHDADIVIVEGVMGLFDGPEGGSGSTHDLAMQAGLPVIIVIDCSHMAQSIRVIAEGFRATCPQLAGFILNRVASPRHEAVLREGLKGFEPLILGVIHRHERLALPSRHLGLVQAGEHPALDQLLETAARVIADSIDVDRIRSLAVRLGATPGGKPLPPLGQRIAIAGDAAFAFCYPHLLHDWRSEGAEISFFSPLANEAPDRSADAIYLPGGYPELHAGKLSAASSFMTGLRNSQALIYGECGGFMVLGEYLIDADGKRHAMAGLLPLGTSFARRKLHLGYRQLTHSGSLPFPARLRGHEFHYSTIDWQGDAEPLFDAADAAGRKLGGMGLRQNRVMGSYAHVIA